MHAPRTKEAEMKRMFKELMRMFIRLGDPCYGCVREYNCELYDMHNTFCGDWGLSYYEKRKDGDA